MIFLILIGSQINNNFKFTSLISWRWRAKRCEQHENSQSNDHSALYTDAFICSKIHVTHHCSYFSYCWLNVYMYTNSDRTSLELISYNVRL